MSVFISDFTEDQQALYDLMSDLSEEHYFAGWICGRENWLWDQLSGIDCGKYNITDTQRQELLAAADKAQGWVVWNDEIDDPEFLTFDEWANYVKLQ